MNKHGHMIVGIVVSCYCVYQGYYILIPGVIVGSRLPDLDVRQGKSIFRRAYNVLPYCKLFGREGWQHRSLLLHSIWTVMVLLGLSLWLSSGLLLGLTMGVISHHISDYNPGYMKRYIRGGV